MALTVAELKAVFSADTSGLKRGDADVRASAKNAAAAYGQAGASIGRTSTQSGNFLRGVRSNLMHIAGPLAIGAVIKSSSQLEQQFSKTMSLMQASTGATGEQMKQLDALAMKMGADTQFSANDAAGAMLELGKAGISTSDIMGGALQGTLLLAAAGGTDLGTAATIASNAMNTFNMRGSDMAKIASALAGGANASSASVESLGQGLQQVGPGAKNAGLSLQQTVGVLSAFDAAGIKGSDAGTSLKTMLVSLIPQTDKAKRAMADLGLEFVNADGSFKSITNIAQQLHDKLGPLSEAQRTQALSTIFGSDAARAASVLMDQGAKGLAKYIRATKDQSAAQKMADAAMKGTSGAMEKLRGSVETAELALGKALAPTIEDLANWLSGEAVPAVTEFITGMQDGTGAGGDFADVLGDLVAGGKTLVGFFNDLPGPVKKFAVEGLIAYAAMSKLQGLMGGGKLSGFISDLKNSETRLDAVSKASYRLGEGLRTAAGAGGMLLLAEASQHAGEKMGYLGNIAGGALLGFSLGGPWGAAIGAGAGALKGLTDDTNASNKAFRDGLKFHEEYIDSLDQVTGAITDATRKTTYQNLENDGTFELGKLYGIPDKTMVDAALGNVAAMERVKKRLAALVESGKVAPEFASDFLNSLHIDVKDIEGASLAIRKQTAATADYKKLLTGFPPKLVTKIEAAGLPVTANGLLKLQKQLHLTPRQVSTMIKAVGIPQTTKDLAKLTRQMRLTPAQIRTLIKESGGTPTKKMIDRIIAAAKALDKENPRPKIGAKNNATQVITSVAQALKNLDGKEARVYIRTVREKTGGGAFETRRASGGRIVGPGGPRDDQVPILASNGEYVINAAAYRRNPGLVEAINSGKIQAYADGGPVGTRLEVLQQLATIRDLNKQLTERKKKSVGKGKHKHEVDAGLATVGLDRTILWEQLAEANKELVRLRSPAPAEDGPDLSTFRDQVAGSIFSTGVTTAKQLLRNLQTSTVTNDQWASMLAGLSNAGLSKGLLDQFTANGPTSQALALGKDILKTGSVGKLNSFSSTIGTQADQYAAWAGGQAASPVSPVHIENFNAYENQTPDEIGERLYFISRVRR